MEGRSSAEPARNLKRRYELLLPCILDWLRWTLLQWLPNKAEIFLILTHRKVDSAILWCLSSIYL